MDSPTLKLLLKPREAAAALSISERTLWVLTKDGTIPAVRISGKQRQVVRYSPAALQTWISQRRSNPAVA